MKTIKCWLYLIYDWAKSLWPVRWVFYHGKKYQHFELTYVSGVVATPYNKASDGDTTFDIKDESGAFWHCEITPCYPIPASTLSQIVIGAHVIIFGTRTFDPAHLNDPDKWEIHPVRQIAILEEK